MDTSADAERIQVAIWRRMSSVQKAALVEGATIDVLTLALIGIRKSHPKASERERFVRLAERLLGAPLVRQVYPDAAQILDPHE